MERATGFEPATLGLGNLLRINDFNSLGHLAYRIMVECVKLRLTFAPSLHPTRSGERVRNGQGKD